MWRRGRGSVVIRKRPIGTGRLGRATVFAIVLACGAAACTEGPVCDPKAEHAKLDFTLKDMNGHDVKLAAYHGRPIVMNFWATWCGPCKEEIPILVELADKYKSSKLAVLGISIDDRPEELKKFATDYKMNYPILVGLGNDELLEAYDAQFAVPISWFVTAGGCVSTKHTGVASKDWFEQQMKALL
jgi:thiol-disulfide isomerase/thioredoxin